MFVLSEDQRLLVFLSIGIVLGATLTLLSHCIFGRCLLSRVEYEEIEKQQ